MNLELETQGRSIRFKVLKIKMLGFWQEYRRSKAGLLGLLFVCGFLLFAIFGPSLAPYDPDETLLATPLALPEWFRMFPEYADLPHSVDFPVQWTGNSTDVFAFRFLEDSELASLLNREEVFVWSVGYAGNLSEEIAFKMFFNFTHNHKPPAAFRFSFRFRVLNLSQMGYNLELTLVRVADDSFTEYSLWDSNFKSSSPERSTEYSYTFGIPGVPPSFPKYVDIGSGQIYDNRLGFQQPDEFLAEAFSSKGHYILEFKFRLNAETPISTCEVQVFDFDFMMQGRVHGLLGTDNRGRDIFSQILYGARISLMVGLLVATLSTSIGVVVGTLSGYIGGITDEFSMRTVDLLMCLPVLPLILIVAEMFGRNLFATVTIIVLLSWMTLARMIRSQVLSLREATFVEAALVAGGTRFTILRQHIFPNVLPLAFSSMILRVPLAILLEATLSFLGLGDPGLFSWGRTMNEAMKGAALANDTWWWLFSPGIAIVLVCLGFVLVSHAFDRIVNPRLRTRR